MRRSALFAVAVVTAVPLALGACGASQPAENDGTDVGPAPAPESATPDGGRPEASADAAAAVDTPDAQATSSTPADAALDPDAAPSAPPQPLPEIWGVDALEDQNPDPRVVEVDLTAAPQTRSLDGELELPMLTYNGQWPGPLLQARVGDRVIVHFHNGLDEPTTIHWHGLRISDQMDGNPRIQSPVAAGADFTYDFVVPEAGTFWYHPHISANTQVERGLYAPFLVHADAEPAYDAERVLMLDDILVDNKGLVPFMASHMEAMHGRFGNVFLVNGKPVSGSAASAAAAREGQVERWRLVNTANARTMSLSLAGASFRVIGTDGGPLAEPYETARVLISPGQRYDLEVRYDAPGAVKLKVYVPVLLPDDTVGEQPADLFAVQVEETGDAPREVTLPEAAPLPGGRPNVGVTLTLNGVNTPRGLEWQINDRAHAHEPLFTFQQGDVVRIVLDNQAGPEHPFHLHGQFFRIFSQRTPETDQPGLKDVVLVPGLSKVEILAFMDNPGTWMMHCHILEHAELGMMAEFEVTPRAE